MQKPVYKGSSRIVIIFTSVHRVRWGRESMVVDAYAFLNVDFDCITIQGR